MPWSVVTYVKYSVRKRETDNQPTSHTTINPWGAHSWSDRDKEYNIFSRDIHKLRTFKVHAQDTAVKRIPSSLKTTNEIFSLWMQELGNRTAANRENSETEDCPTLLTLLSDEINRILNFTYSQTPHINSVSSEAERDTKWRIKW